MSNDASRRHSIEGRVVLVVWGLALVAGYLFGGVLEALRFTVAAMLLSAGVKRFLEAENKRRHALLAVAGLCGAATIVARIWASRYPLLDPREPSGWAALLSTGIALTIVPVALLAGRARRTARVPESRGRTVAVVLAQSALVLVVAFLGAREAITVANGLLDHGEESSNVTRVVALRDARRNNRERTEHDHSLVVASWRTGREHEVFHIDEPEYRSAHVGQSVLVRTRPGGLGLPWVLEKRLLPVGEYP